MPLHDGQRLGELLEGGFRRSVGLHLVKQADDALTARELIKGKVLETAPESARDAAEALAKATGAEVVQVIGRTFVLYRPAPEEPKIVLPRAR